MQVNNIDYGDLQVSYPNNFDIENVLVKVKDNSFLLPVNTEFGKYIKNYFDPRPVDVMRKMADRHGG